MRLLKRIIAVVKDSPAKVVVVKYDGGPRLQIFDCERKIVLPVDLYEKFEQQGQGVGGEDTF